MNILYLVPDLGDHATGRRVRALVTGLPRDRFTPHVVTLRTAAQPFDFPVDNLGMMRRFDPRIIVRFRRLLADRRPDVVHAFRLPAVRLAALCAVGISRLFVTDADHGGRPTVLDRGLINLVSARNVELPPVVDPPIGEAPPLPGLPAGARLIVCAGALTPSHGFRDAIWAFDGLRRVYPDLHFVLIGDGPERQRLEQFGRDIGIDDGRAHFIPARPDAAALLAHAEVVWVPSRRPCGEQVAAEALAAGVPVVASNLRALSNVVGDAGLLVPPGAIADRMRQTRTILDFPDRRRQLAEKAQQRAEQYRPQKLMERAMELYR